MRAVVLRAYGGRDQLRVEELPDPEPGPRDVLVRMAASGLNRLDVFVRQGLTGPGVRSPRSLPHVMGAEGAGTVLSVGPDAGTDLVPGDEVIVFSGLSCGHCPYCRRGENSRCAGYAILGEDVWGVQRSLVALPATSLLRVPPGMTLDEAAAVPTTYTTAYTMLMTAGRLRVGERVLVVGGSGGVSIAAMQLAAAAGAEVWTTTRSAAKAKRLAALPYVDHVLTGPDWADAVREATGGVDVVVDSVGGPTWRDSIRSLAMGGRMLICGATGGDRPDISIRELYQSHRQIIGAPFGGWNDFVDVVGLLERTGLRPLLHAVVPMEEAAEAHRILEESEHVGKVVLALR
jgi:NADPH:quinone reductase-like Zn-dependent oxidoreductase